MSRYSNLYLEEVSLNDEKEELEERLARVNARLSEINDSFCSLEIAEDYREHCSHV